MVSKSNKGELVESIIQLIPIGSENAISRKGLVRKCISYGLIDEDCKDPDRKMRRLIETAKLDWAIITTEHGGYFQPMPKSSKDRLELMGYIERETKKAKSIFMGIKKASALLEDCVHERFDYGYNPYQE